MYIVLTVDTLSGHPSFRDRPHAVDPNHFGPHNPTFVRTRNPSVHFGINAYCRSNDRPRVPIPVGSHSRRCQRRWRRIGRTGNIMSMTIPKTDPMLQSRRDRAVAQYDGCRNRRRGDQTSLRVEQINDQTDRQLSHPSLVSVRWCVVMTVPSQWTHNEPATDDRYIC